MRNLSKLSKEFSFAGFSFPKYVWTLDRRPVAQRVQRMKNPATGPYYHKPTPNTGGIGFYLNSDGGVNLRWTWADEVESVRIDHTGWYSDEYGDAEKIRGVVFRLPKGKGFLAGWSMGEGMASEIEPTIYTDESDAAYAADSIAERVAERERDYQESQREEGEE